MSLKFIHNRTSSGYHGPGLYINLLIINLHLFNTERRDDGTLYPIYKLYILIDRINNCFAFHYGLPTF